MQIGSIFKEGPVLFLFPLDCIITIYRNIGLFLLKLSVILELKFREADGNGTGGIGPFCDGLGAPEGIGDIQLALKCKHSGILIVNMRIRENALGFYRTAFYYP
jgi:hypothetical protein